jgi:hypothetical protein
LAGFGADSGCDYLGYVVRPHGIAVRRRTIKSFKRRLYVFNHLLNPRDFPHFDPPPQSSWGRDVRAGLVVPPVVPTPGLLQHMKQVINSYFGSMCHANSYRLRRTIYLRDFHRLKDYFIPAEGINQL